MGTKNNPACVIPPIMPATSDAPEDEPENKEEAAMTVPPGCSSLGTTLGADNREGNIMKKSGQPAFGVALIVRLTVWS